MSDESRLVIAIAIGVIVATLTFFHASMAAVWALGNCWGLAEKDPPCQLAGYSTYGCCFFPIAGPVAFAIGYFALPKKLA